MRKIKTMLPRRVAVAGVIVAVVMLAGVTAAVATGNTRLVGDNYRYGYLDGTDRSGVTSEFVSRRPVGGQYLPQQACQGDWLTARDCIVSLVFAHLDTKAEIAANTYTDIDRTLFRAVAGNSNANFHQKRRAAG